MSLSWQLTRSLNSRCTAGVILLGTKPVWLIWKSAKCGPGSTEHSCMVLVTEELPLPPHPPIKLSQWQGVPSCHFFIWNHEMGEGPAVALFLHNHSQASPHSTGRWVWQLSSSSQANQLFLDLSSVIMYHVLGHSFYLWSLTHYLNEFTGTNSNWFLYLPHRMS